MVEFNAGRARQSRHPRRRLAARRREPEGTVKVIDGVSLYANATLNDANYTGSNFPVAESPRGTAAIGPVARRDGFHLSTLGKFVGPRYLLDQSRGGTVQHPTVPIKFCTDVDMSVGHTWAFPNLGGRFLNFRANLPNVFNNRDPIDFQGNTASGDPLPLRNPGRGLFVSVPASM